MFLSNYFSFSLKNEDLIHENMSYKMYNTTYNNHKAVKLIFNEDISRYNILKNIHHENILKPNKMSTSGKYVITQYLIPFRSVFDPNTTEYNTYIFLKLAQALDFLHKTCKVQHNNLDITSLFFTEEGKVVLGGFEKSKNSNYFDSDNIQFSNLLSKYLNIDCNLEQFIERNDERNNLFYELEIFIFGFDSIDLAEKKNILQKILSKKSEFIDLYKKRIVNVYLRDLKGDFDKFYKEDVLDMIFNLELQDYNKIIIEMFNILDTNVRLYLFAKSRLYINKIDSLDSCVEAISLGIKVKNKILRKESILFLKAHNSKCSDKSRIKILENMYSFISDPEGVLLILDYLNATRPYFEKNEIVYKMIKKIIMMEECKLECLKTIQILYPTFSKHKLSTELLPLLCLNLADKNVQSFTFQLIYEILNDLSLHKEAIISKEWNLKTIKNIFVSKKDTRKDADDKKDVVDKIYIDDKKDVDNELCDEDEWDDEW